MLEAKECSMRHWQKRWDSEPRAAWKRGFGEIKFLTRQNLTGKGKGFHARDYYYSDDVFSSELATNFGIYQVSSQK